MMTLEGVFAYPHTPTIIVGVVSAALGAVLGAWLNHFFAKRRMNDENEVKKRNKEQEIKDDITSKMTEVISYTMTNSLLSTQRMITDSNSEKIKAEDDESFRKFQADVNAISSKLQSYFPETGISDKWARYYEVLLAFRYLSKDYSFEHVTDEQKNGFKFRSEAIKKYFTDHEKIDWNRFTTQMTFHKELSGNVAQLVANRGYEIIREISNLHIKDYYK
jgi:gas vesicle protein